MDRSKKNIHRREENMDRSKKNIHSGKENQLKVRETNTVEREL